MSTDHYSPGNQVHLYNLNDKTFFLILMRLCVFFSFCSALLDLSHKNKPLAPFQEQTHRTDANSPIKKILFEFITILTSENVKFKTRLL